MTFHAPPPTSAHRNLIRFDSDVAVRVDARALDASATRAYVRDCKQLPNVTIVRAATVLQSRKRSHNE